MYRHQHDGASQTRTGQECGSVEMSTQNVKVHMAVLFVLTSNSSQGCFKQNQKNSTKLEMLCNVCYLYKTFTQSGMLAHAK